MTNAWKRYSDTTSPGGVAPPFVPIGALRDPNGYVPSPDLSRAVDVAVTLGLPLLLTGDPGCGKTQLAWHLAGRFAQKEPIVFHAKTTSVAQDLFYRYDSLEHFHASNFGTAATPPDVMRFIHPQALGLAILRALNPEYLKPWVAMAADDVHAHPLRSVVLIDEIDKAPRDFPNDVLDEIESMSFTIRETGRQVPERKAAVDPQYRPIVILTSNSERNLPPAFLRRCAYFNIPTPDADQLKEIVRKRLKLDSEFFSPAKVDEAIALFVEIRGLGLKKPPSTDEFLKWLHLLNEAKIEAAAIGPGNQDALFMTCALLAKSRDDASLVKTLLKKR